MPVIAPPCSTRSAARRAVRCGPTRADGPRRLHGWLLALIVTWCALAGAHAAVRPLTPAETRIAGLVEVGRTRPAEALEGLEAMARERNLTDADRLGTVIARGLLQAGERDPAVVATLTALEAWKTAPQAAEADAMAHLVRARIANVALHNREADRLATEASTRLPADASPLHRLRCVALLARLRNEAGRLDDALRLWLDAQKLADEIGRPAERADVRRQLAYTFLQTGAIERARTTSQEALQIAEAAQDWYTLANANNTAAILYDAAGDLPGQRRALQAAIDNARRAGARPIEALALANMSNLFLAAGDYRQALALAGQALPLAREQQEQTAQVVALANMGLAQIALRKIDAGRALVQEALAIERRRGRSADEADLQLELGKSLEKAGDAAGAVTAYHAYRRTSDEMFQRGNQKAMLEVHERFEAEQRGARLDLLEREKRLKDAQLRNAELRQRLWIVMAVISLLSFGVLALMVRRVRVANRALTQANRELDAQGGRDPLTGLANRRQCQAVMRTLNPLGMMVGTLCLIDIDHFKRLNDTHGHAAGDAVLIEVARRLRETVREQDLVVRWGGEEFLVVMPEMAVERVDALAQRMLDAIGETPVAFREHTIGLTASIGYASFPIGPSRLSTSWERAVKLVDNAMYLAKARGRNRACGVQSLLARDEADIVALAGALESASREGRASLTWLHGRVAA